MFYGTFYFYDVIVRYFHDTKEGSKGRIKNSGNFLKSSFINCETALRLGAP